MIEYYKRNQKKFTTAKLNITNFNSMDGSRQDKSKAKWLIKLSNSIPKLHEYEVVNRTHQQIAKMAIASLYHASSSDKIEQRQHT